MGFAKEDKRNFQEANWTTFTRTCAGAKLTFTGAGSKGMTELQIRWWLDFFQTLKKD